MNAAGPRLSGQCVDRLTGGRSPIKPGTVHRLTTGNVVGNRVQWSYKVGLGKMSIDVNYAGELARNRMTGTVSLTGMGRGNFTALKG